MTTVVVGVLGIIATLITGFTAFHNTTNDFRCPSWLLAFCCRFSFLCPKYLALKKFPFPNRLLNKWAYMNERETKSMEGYGEAVFATEYLCKEYRHTVALRDVSITIPRGQIYGLIGENGAGKTTLLRILCGLTRPTRGRLLLFGAADAARQSEMRRRMGCLVDGPALYADLTAWQNLKVQCLQRGLNEADIAPTLQLVGLKDTGSKPAGKFSLGMRQRLGLAVALLGKPEFLVLDEPLNGLDPMGIQELRHLLEKLNREQGMTILLSSHILSELHQLATSYGILHNGQLLEQLTAEELDARCSKYLLVRTDNDRRAVDILRKMFPEAICQATVEGLRLSPLGNEAAATASGVLMENGLHVQELAVRSEGLEAYFTALVGGDSHADAG